MITIQNYNKEQQKLRFVTDMPIGLANAIRRSVLEIPVMAIEEVEIIKNDSALYDEIIAHRIGLIPIKTSSNKTINFKLKGQGPKMIYSTDIQPSVETDYKLPIVLLDNEQEIELIANASLGKGIDHIKYSPGLIFYSHNIDTNILDFVCVDEEGKISFDEEELKTKNVSEETITKIKKAKEARELVFTVESWKQIEVKEIFTKAIEVLNKNLEEISKSIK
jgi:DNA-directed RNA polymerase subunit D